MSRGIWRQYGVTGEVQRLRDQVVRIYLLYLVGITIFSDKSQCDVDVVYLKYFRYLDLCAGYSWGAAALAHLYKELNNAARWNTSQVAGYLSLLQAWVFHHFPGMGSKDVWEGYVENQYPRAMLFLPLHGLGIVDNYKNYLDALDLTRVVMTPYAMHRQARQFERVNLYSRWLRCGERMVRYLPKRVLRQFGWV